MELRKGIKKGLGSVTSVPLVIGMIFIGIFPNYVVATINSTSEVIVQYLLP